MLYHNESDESRGWYRKVGYCCKEPGRALSERNREDFGSGLGEWLNAVSMANWYAVEGTCVESSVDGGGQVQEVSEEKNPSNRARGHSFVILAALCP